MLYFLSTILKSLTVCEMYLCMFLLFAVQAVLDYKTICDQDCINVVVIVVALTIIIATFGGIVVCLYRSQQSCFSDIKSVGSAMSLTVIPSDYMNDR